MLEAWLSPPKAGAQWSGITTRLAERLLETAAVDAVLTVRPDPEDRWKPVPTLVTRAGDLAQVRGMRMGYGPLLALLEPARAAGVSRLAVIGIPCQVYALRALEERLGFDELYVIGTPCSDNTTTENFHRFLALLSDRPETINYLEFRADYQVELRFDDVRVPKRFRIGDEGFGVEAPDAPRIPAPVLLGQTIAHDLKGSWWSRWWHRRRRRSPTLSSARARAASLRCDWISMSHRPRT